MMPIRLRWAPACCWRGMRLSLFVAKKSTPRAEPAPHSCPALSRAWLGKGRIAADERAFGPRESGVPAEISSAVHVSALAADGR